MPDPTAAQTERARKLLDEAFGKGIARPYAAFELEEGIATALATEAAAARKAALEEACRADCESCRDGDVSQLGKRGGPAYYHYWDENHNDYCWASGSRSLMDPSAAARPE